VVAVLAAGVFGASSTARAQSSEGSPFSVDFAIGWDNDLTGNINSSGIGNINNQVVVVTKNRSSASRITTPSSNAMPSTPHINP